MLKKQKSGSILCPSCGKLISVNSKSCIYCGRKQPGLWGYGPALKNIFTFGMDFVPIVTGICIVLYLISLLVKPLAIFQMRGFLGFLSPDIESLVKLGATGSYPLLFGRWWTVLTAIYLHGNILHIFFNLYWLQQLGNYTREFYGTSRLIIIFTVSGIVGFVFSNSMGIQLTIGASGSIFGLLGALIYYGRSRGGIFGMSIYRQVGVWAVVLFMFGFIWPQVNNWAHFGGLVGGYLCALVVGYQENKPEHQVHLLLALVCIIATVVAFGLAILL